MRNKRRLALALALVAAFLSSKAWADSIQITLIPTSQTTVVGGTVTFFAILTNLTNTTQFLNGDSATTSSTFLSVNDASFFANAPLSLGPGASTSLIPLFSVLVALGTPAGTYTSNNFTILGGVLTDDFNPIGAADFDVTVTVAPEPGTLLLLATGALGLGIRKRLVSD